MTLDCCDRRVSLTHPDPRQSRLPRGTERRAGPILDGRPTYSQGARMSISKSIAFVPSILAAGRLGAAFKAAMDTTGLVEPGQLKEVTVHRDLADGSRQSQRVPLAEIDS